MLQISRLQQRMLLVVFGNIRFIVQIYLELPDFMRQERDRRLPHIIPVIPVCRRIYPVQEVLPVRGH